MILYSYICFDCFSSWDGWRDVDNNSSGVCPVCESINTGRDYQAENKTVRGDIKPGFNRSTGIRYSGRKDLFTKMKAAGFGSVAHGGGIVQTDKTFYGDEKYQYDIMNKGKVNQQYLELLQRGVEDSKDEQGNYKSAKLMKKF